MLRIAVLASVLLSALARGQAVRDCRRIVDNLERLTCYDKAVDQSPAHGGLGLPGEDEHVVASFTGEGNKITPGFTVSAPWELRWTPSDGSITVFLKTSSGQVVDTYTTGSDVPAGRAMQPEGGEFFLDVHAFRPWQVQAVEVAR